MKTSGCFALLTAFLILFSLPAQAQSRNMVDYPVVKLRSIDKITARTLTFQAKVGNTIKFGPLYIKVQACRKTPPIEQPEAAAFLQIWEVSGDEQAEWIYSGWMFASSPGLSPMDHPIYDVWVLDCQEKKDKDEEQPAPEDAREDEGEITNEEAVPAQPEIQNTPE